ncbi:camp-dependent protein kinase catalytic subunit [Fimicolochytrium jonesii]|uniref:camp-dependent protein kinase catalytic subunit n=1 Tax=Fimicolochytrium jonesii TaxID=1396493 RepID=UPI0022FE8AEB|nr:camp-dependent protein kinase catalytic subunit [Fimicolochytrium jonesii]KAI8821016.1 camp-dependent protein kinase catalytic subunit [Fimicolochytrium jonesii]
MSAMSDIGGQLNHLHLNSPHSTPSPSGHSSPHTQPHTPQQLPQPITRGDARGLALSDFVMLKTLGTGTFGRVYLTRYRDTDRFYAMKVLSKKDVVRLKQVEHINSEKNILSRIDHPFLVTMDCTFQDDRNLYMLLEYVVGGELFSHLRRAGRFSNDMTRFYAAEIVLAIEYLHSMDIIYRDLKPENLLLDNRGDIKITDFGFAKEVQDRTWTLCGTPEYLAPEIIQSKGHGKAVDWWALGILIFEMLAGYPPYFDDNPFGIYEKILTGRLSFPPYFDPAAKDLIKKLLAPDRTKRLGNLRGGADDVKQHKWFRGVDWATLLAKQVPCPIVPSVAGPGDTRHFETYPEVEEEESDGMDPFGHLFRGF